MPDGNDPLPVIFTRRGSQVTCVDRKAGSLGAQNHLKSRWQDELPLPTENSGQGSQCTTDYSTLVDASGLNGMKGILPKTAFNHCDINGTETRADESPIPQPLEDDAESIWSEVTQLPRRHGKGKKRVFGIGREKHDYISPDDYGQRYPPDDFGQEMGPNARVWRVYLDEAELNDRDMVEGWKDGIDVLLVFAGLFSAVVTTFVTQTSQKLDQDFNQISASLLTELIAIQRAAAAGLALEDVPASELTLSSHPSFTRADARVNGLWFTSLTLSLITALAAVLIKQWIQHYVSFVSGTPQERARVHQFRYIGLQRWRVRVIVGVLPLLLYTALFSFILGLVLFLQVLKPEIAYVVGVLGGLTLGLYVVSNGLPLFFPQCPYYTPLIELISSSVAVAIVGYHQTAFFLTHRAIPTFLSQKWMVKILHGRVIRLSTRCQRLLKVKSPSYQPTALRIAESQAAELEQDSIVCEITHWLLAMSSNPSVRPIALEAISGLRFGFPFTDELLREGGLVRKELTSEVKNREFVTVQGFHKSPAFVDTPLFYSTERILRASMHIQGYSIPLSLKLVDQKLFNDLTPTTSLSCQMALATYHIYTHNQPQNSRGLLQTLSTLVHTAGQYTMVWGAWFNVLRDKERATLCSDLGFGGIYRALSPLFSTMLDSEYNHGTWSVLLPLICKVLPRQIVRPQGNDILVPLTTLQANPSNAKAYLCSMLLRGVIMECEEDPSRSVEFEGLLGYAALICFGDRQIAVASLGDLISRPFFPHTRWSRSTYKLLFDLYLKAHQSPPFLTPPEAFSSHEHLRSVLANARCLHGLWSVLFRPFPTRRSHLSATVNAIVQVLEGQECSNPSEVVIQNVFATFMDVDWVQCSVVAREVPCMSHESDFDHRYLWPPQVQPLIRWMIAYTIAHGDTGTVPSHSSVRRFSIRLAKQPAFFTFICSAFFIAGDHTVVFSTHSYIVLQLALYHRNVPKSKESWNQFLRWLRDRSNWIHHNSELTQNWTKTNFEHYHRMADFVDQLIGSIELDSPSSEFRLPRFAERTPGSSKMRGYRNQDAQNERSGSAKPILRKWLPWRAGSHRQVDAPASHDLVELGMGRTPKTEDH